MTKSWSDNTVLQQCYHAKAQGNTIFFKIRLISKLLKKIADSSTDKHRWLVGLHQANKLSQLKKLRLLRLTEKKRVTYVYSVLLSESSVIRWKCSAYSSHSIKEANFTKISPAVSRASYIQKLFIDIEWLE